MTRFALGILWLLHWLPLPIIAALGRGLGRLLYRFGHARRRIALINLGLCFPGMSAQQKSALARRHFEAFGRSFLERGLLWWASAERIRKIGRVVGRENLDAVYGKQPVILLVPHFVGLDMAWTRMSMDYDMSGIYANQKNLLFNAALYKGRARFGNSLMLSRQDSTRKGVKAMKAGMPFFYLPDMDFGERDTIFVPFFGYPAATITGLSRLARIAGAVVIPVIAHMESDGYLIEIGAPWPDFPGATIEGDTRRMNAYIESEVVKMPEQYFWLHKRFKTRPPGEKNVYQR
ncbi:MAG TPA: lipid A biosynthesis acyltransferase [Rhodocyclaceae bacterium]|nr:lipid A biosynthesis acyltransferase [Rhodocyclaceae bacterium]